MRLSLTSKSCPVNRVFAVRGVEKRNRILAVRVIKRKTNNAANCQKLTASDQNVFHTSMKDWAFNNVESCTELEYSVFFARRVDPVQFNEFELEKNSVSKSQKPRLSNFVQK